MQQTRARSTDPTTSHEAADSVAGKMADSKDEVLFILATSGPLADHEIVGKHTELLARFDSPPIYSPQRLRTARHELTETGQIIDTGIYRLTPSSRRAKVWELA